MVADYKDPTHVPETWEEVTNENFEDQAKQIELYIRQKMYGVDVRESLARWVEVGSAVMALAALREQEFTNKVTGQMANDEKRISDVEERQSEVEDTWKKTLGSLTQDDEVKNARSSVNYGKFVILDDRLENIETMLAKNVAIGFQVKLPHGLNRNPTISVSYYEYAIGTEPGGLGNGPKGTFGGTPPYDVTSSTTYDDANNATVELPISYRMNGSLLKHSDGNWYLTEGYKTLKFTLS